MPLACLISTTLSRALGWCPIHQRICTCHKQRPGNSVAECDGQQIVQKKLRPGDFASGENTGGNDEHVCDRVLETLHRSDRVDRVNEWALKAIQWSWATARRRRHVQFCGSIEHTAECRRLLAACDAAALQGTAWLQRPRRFGSARVPQTPKLEIERQALCQAVT